MKYRPTPLNIFCGLAIGLAIYSAIKPGPEAWGFLLALYLIPIVIVGLLIDFVLQKHWTKYFTTFGSELLLLAAIYFAYSWTTLTASSTSPKPLATITKDTDTNRISRNFEVI